MNKMIREFATARAPRYTSYPTAPMFRTDGMEENWPNWLRDLDPGKPISLYLHVPFCQEVCWYCACNMKLGRNEAILDDYATVLKQEICQTARALPGRMNVGHIHWGGGTPTAIGAHRLARIMTQVFRQFNVLPDAEVAVELDPRTFDPESAPILRRMGVTRASLGVQTFDEKVQNAINRIQPFAKVMETVDALQEAGITKLNFDMMYGLPYQTGSVLSDDIDLALSLSPDRVSLFGYAHVPWVAKRQKRLPEAALPDSDARLDAAFTSHRQIIRSGYVPIGLDHYALPADSMVAALADKTLRRNFQGYTTDQADTMLGFGASAIGKTPQGFAQNALDTRGWKRRVEAGRHAVVKGLSLTEDDRLRGAVIEEIMCQMCCDVAAVLRRFGRDADTLDAEIAALDYLEQAGVVSVFNRQIRVQNSARPALRLVAAAFDAYRDPAASQTRHAVAV